MYLFLVSRLRMLESASSLNEMWFSLTKQYCYICCPQTQTKKLFQPLPLCKEKPGFGVSGTRSDVKWIAHTWQQLLSQLIIFNWSHDTDMRFKRGRLRVKSMITWCDRWLRNFLGHHVLAPSVFHAGNCDCVKILRPWFLTLFKIFL